LADISFIAESEKECEEVMATYKFYEKEIVDFLSSMRKVNLVLANLSSKSCPGSIFSKI